MQKFNEKINKVKNAFKGIENKKIDMSKQVKMDSLVRQFELASNEAELLRNKLKGLQSELAQKQQWEVGTKSYVKLQSEIDKTSLQFQKASIKVDDLNDKLNALETANISTGISQSTIQLTKGLDKMTSKIKRFGLSLFSVRSIWALVSKASSAYLSQDTELADKLQSVWASLGAMLAPVIEGIANILMKAVGYINIFVKALTGVDLLAKASAKSMDKAAKSAKGLNKSLAGFDELNNLDTDTGSNIDTGISNPLASIQDIELPWADSIKAFGEWVKENIPTVTGLLAGLTVGIIAFKLGLDEIKSVGIGLVMTGVVKGIQDLIELIKNPSWENFGKVVFDIGLIISGVGAIIGGIPALIVGALTLIVGYAITHWEQLKEGFKLLGSFIVEIFWTLISTTEGIFTTIALIIRAPFDMLWDLTQDVANGIKTILGGIVKVFKGIFTGDLKTVLEGFKQIFKGIFDSLWAIVKAPLNLIIRGFNALISGINIIKFDVPDWVPGIGGKRLGFNIPKIPLLNVGTNYVPEDQLAYIHKGEAVVPKKFNSQEYFGSGNEETNSLLEQVIEAINNIEVNPYTTIKDVGKTAVNYINSKNRQLGRSVV